MEDLQLMLSSSIKNHNEYLYPYYVKAKFNFLKQGG